MNLVRVRSNKGLGFVCVNRHIRVQSPPRQHRRSYSSIRGEFSGESADQAMVDLNGLSECGNRVMVVVDSTIEAKGALQWALSHTVQDQDTIILLHVTKPPSSYGGNINGEVNHQRAHELVSSMKSMCQLKRPGVKVEVQVRQGKEKGPTIVEEAKQQGVSLLVLGQHKRTLMWRVRMMWARRRGGNRAVDYCIQNANCMTIAVRRKSKKHGGYLITTKRHKNFWLLA